MGDKKVKIERSTETFLLQEEAVAKVQIGTNLGERRGNRKLQVDFLAGLFGISAWLSVVALYTQLPILVQSAPEGWKLPSYLSVAVQVANIGPVAYGFSNKYLPGLFSDSKLIYLSLFTGSLSLILMGLYYDTTLVLFGASHSVVLCILAFSVALVGCTSSVLFIPFMNHYVEIHLISYMIGEGLGGCFPSLVSLIQGVGGNPSCINTTTLSGETISTSYYPPPLFSTKIFFFSMFLIMAVSTVAFFLLNNLPSCKIQKIRKSTSERSAKSSVEYSDPAAKDNLVLSLSSFGSKTLLLLTAVLSAFSNGALPSVQSYSCLPYGNVAYHLAVNLCNIANPVACFAAYFVPTLGKHWTLSMVLLAGVSVTYAFTTASLSPHPPLQDSPIGVFLNVLSWVVCFGLISYVKMSIAVQLRRKGGKGLFQYGAMTQLGAFLGSIITFVLINYFNAFTSYYPCD